VRTLLIPLASKLRNEDLTKRVLDTIKSSLSNLYKYEADIVDDKEALRGLEFDVGISIVLTGGTEELIIGLAKIGKSVIYVAHDKLNSLPALLEAAPLIKDLNNVVIASVSDPRPDVEAFVRACKALLTLKGFRVGLIGGISPWIVYSKADPGFIKKRLGIEIVNIDLKEVIDLYEQMSVPKELRNKVVKRALNVIVTSDEVTNALKIYLALKTIVRNYKLNAISVRCFDLIESLRTTACLALSLLNNEGITAACEGDVMATLAMVLGQLISGKPTFMANPAWVKNNKMLLAHCTIPTAICDTYDLLTHFESGIGVAVRGIPTYSKYVTLLRLSNDLKRMRVVLGRPVIPTRFSDEHCRTQIIVECKDSLEGVVKDSIGNHYVMMLGNHVRGLGILGKLLGIKDIEIIK